MKKILKKPLYTIMSISIIMLMSISVANGVYIDVDAYWVTVTECEAENGLWSSVSVYALAGFRDNYEDFTAQTSWVLLNTFTSSGTFTPSPAIKLDPSGGPSDYDFGRYDNGKTPVRLRAKIYIREYDVWELRWFYNTYYCDYEYKTPSVGSTNGYTLTVNSDILPAYIDFTVTFNIARAD